MDTDPLFISVRI